MTTLIVIVAVLVLLNGLFVAAEFAIVGTPRVAIDSRAADGELLARRVRRARGSAAQDRFIATAQLGITLASLGLGMYSEHQVAERLVHWLEGPASARPLHRRAHARQHPRRRDPDVRAHRLRRDGSQVDRVAAGRAHRAVDHAGDAGDPGDVIRSCWR